MSLPTPMWLQAAETPIAPSDALRRIVYLLDRKLAPAQKARAFQRAADVIDDLPDGELEALAKAGRVQDLTGVGKSTGQVIDQAMRGDLPTYLAELEAEPGIPLSDDGEPYRAALKGDCHLHSNWSDGGAPIEHMALTARHLGHDYMVLTDHSPRLTVAHGLNRERLEQQLVVIDRLNELLDPFRILTGMEVDILEDGTLDLDDDLLARLDVVVASVHSKLRMDGEAMTRRMVMAVANPHVDILGHCTGRKISADGVMPADGADLKRQPSSFDPEMVFAACAQFNTAVEINCRPERQDPPDDLLDQALEWECLISIDTDAHAPGQLEWQPYGCDKAAAHGIDIERIVNTWARDALLDWVAEPAAS